MLKDTTLGTSWTDTAFTGDDRIYWSDYRPANWDDDLSGDVYKIEWKRIKDVFSSGYSLWGSEDISFADPKQGEIGDCWMIAASSVTAQDPNRIRDLFEIEYLNSAGIYAVNMFVMGVPVTVTVDDYLPFHDGTN